MNTHLTRLAAAGLVVLGATGCSMLPASAPNTDAQFGQSVRQTMAAQIANPNAGRNGSAQAGFDAQAARHALTRHRDSFKSPPPTFSIIGIGGSSGGGGQ